MNFYNEFFTIVETFENNRISYAVIGGVALAFHDRPRFTRDIDIFVDYSQLAKVEEVLSSLNFVKSTDPHQFLNVDLILHRFIKIKNDDHLLVDILAGKEKKFNRILKNAVRATWQKGEVTISSKKDLIWLKRFRNSDQDKIDIQNLSNHNDENEKNKN